MRPHEPNICRPQFCGSLEKVETCQELFSAIDDSVFAYRQQRVIVLQQRSGRRSFDLREKAKKDVRRALASLEAFYAGWDEDSKNLQALRKICNNVESSEYDILAGNRPIRSNSQLRRATRGRPSTHIKLLYDRLKKAGVPLEDRKEIAHVLGFFDSRPA